MVGLCPTVYLVAAAILVLPALLCGAQDLGCFPGQAQEDPAANYHLNLTKFSFNVFKKFVIRESKNGGVTSFVMSPFSVWSVLGLAYFGAEGNTQLELAKVLRFSTDKNAAYRLWKTFQERNEEGSGAESQSTFLSTNLGYFSNHLTLNQCVVSLLQDQLKMVDFSQPAQAAQEINSAVSGATKGQIQDFVHPGILTHTEFLLLNAVYFQGLWTTQFPEAKTIDGVFHTEDPQVHFNVQMMASNALYKYVPAKETQLYASIVELPYKSNFSMYLLLPDTPARRLQEVVKRIRPWRLEKAVSHMKPAHLHLTFPKFSLTSKMDDVLQEVLEGVGVVELFSDKATLTAFTNSALYLDKIIHKATIRVDEKGTVASAVTGLLDTRVSIQSISFTCDRPFVFIIMDKWKKIPVVMGTFSGPTSAH